MRTSWVPHPSTKENIGLSRDDCLPFFRNINGPQSERIKTDFQKTFKKKMALDILIQGNMTVVNYLDEHRAQILIGRESL